MNAYAPIIGRVLAAKVILLGLSFLFLNKKTALGCSRMDIIAHEHHQRISGTQHMCAEETVPSAKLPGNFLDLGFMREHNRLRSWHNVAKIAYVRVFAQIPRQRPMLRRVYRNSDIFLCRVRRRNGLNLADQSEKVTVGMRVDIGIALDRSAGAVII